ncbi:hypothetical protein HPB47_024402 [Ixodes persulcatus]|uniref:Uncharacterized protein n=2 Tax=Ixodes persulcatus TaxID=34615 RepID=A0AC60Q4H8_IXOPE|nr:hypothetical protein HPB47_004298 [Ixodes persulcatus]KAG0428615.1 hypothetical protein HPB47_024402 [Ixodes persulcatus]
MGWGKEWCQDEQELGPHPRVASVQVLTCREMVPRDPVQVYEGAQNNLPDDAALVAATAIVTLISRLQATDLLLVLISGGGSALLPLPLEPLTLQEKVATIRLLSEGGAKVQEINSVRKRLSVVKGGNLLRHTRAKARDGLVVAVLYVLPATPTRGIEAFMMDVFGWVMLGDNTSAVVTGDFNVDIARPEGKLFTSFMLERFGLACVNEPTVPTTRHRTFIDLVFMKNVSAVSIDPMAVYPSDHKAMVTVATK